MKRAFHCMQIIAAACLLLLLAGCAGYRLGPTNGESPGARSIQVQTFANKTLEPRLSETVTESVRKHIQKDGTYRLETHGRGDIIVTGAIVDYERSGISFQPTDVITPQDYFIQLIAQVTAREPTTGKVLFDRRVVGRTTMRVTSDMNSAERQAAPLLADDLARNIAALLADGTW